MAKYKSIVLSGQPVSGKSTLAKELEKETGWKIVSIGDLLRDRFGKEHPDREIRFEDWYSSLPIEYTRKINEDAKKLFEAGGIIGESRITSYLDPEKCLRIFVWAKLGVRAERARNCKEYGNMPEGEIRKLLLQRGRDELRVSEGLFGVDYTNPKYFDLMLDTGDLTVKEELEKVKALINAQR